MELNTSPKTINRKISTLKSFYKFLLKKGIINYNPLLKVVTPKVPKRLPLFVSENDMQNLLDKIEFENSFEGKRNKLILELFYVSGIRLTELINLKINDIDLENSLVKVLGKRNKERLIPINKTFILNLKSYLNEAKNIRKSNNYVFLTLKGEKIYQKLVYRIVNYYLSIVTTISKKSPHILRHTFATHMLNNGADLNAIKEILGHSSLAATQVYTHNSLKKLKTIYNQAHPRA